MLNCAVQNHFQAIEKLRTSKSKRPTHHRQSLITISRRYFSSLFFIHANPKSKECFMLRAALPPIFEFNP